MPACPECFLSPRDPVTVHSTHNGETTVMCRICSVDWIAFAGYRIKEDGDG